MTQVEWQLPRVEALLAERPDASVASIMEELGISKGTAWKHRKTILERAPSTPLARRPRKVVQEDAIVDNVEEPLPVVAPAPKPRAADRIQELVARIDELETERITHLELIARLSAENVNYRA